MTGNAEPFNDEQADTPQCVILTFPLPGSAKARHQPFGTGPIAPGPVHACRIVQTGTIGYKVILSRLRGGDSDHAFPTMQAAEAFMRSELPMPAKADPWGRGARTSP